MLTFQIVQNSRTGTIEFIPVGNYNGKTPQIQIIPKPAPTKSEDEQSPGPNGSGNTNNNCIVVGGNKPTPPISIPVRKDGKAKNSGCLVSFCLVLLQSRKVILVSCLAPGWSAIKVPKKRGRPPRQSSGTNWQDQQTEVVGQVTAALKSLGAKVSPVSSQLPTIVKKIEPSDSSGHHHQNGVNCKPSPTASGVPIVVKVQSKIDKKDGTAQVDSFSSVLVFGSVLMVV